MSLKTLDQSGLGYLWGKILGKLSTKADLVNGKVPASQLPSSAGGEGTSYDPVFLEVVFDSDDLDGSNPIITGSLAVNTLQDALSAFEAGYPVVILLESDDGESVTPTIIGSTIAEAHTEDDYSVITGEFFFDGKSLRVQIVVHTNSVNVSAMRLSTGYHVITASATSRTDLTSLTVTSGLVDSVGSLVLLGTPILLIITVPTVLPSSGLQITLNIPTYSVLLNAINLEDSATYGALISPDVVGIISLDGEGNLEFEPLDLGGSGSSDYGKRFVAAATIDNIDYEADDCVTGTIPIDEFDIAGFADYSFVRIGDYIEPNELIGSALAVTFVNSGDENDDDDTETVDIDISGIFDPDGLDSTNALQYIAGDGWYALMYYGFVPMIIGSRRQNVTGEVNLEGIHVTISAERPGTYVCSWTVTGSGSVTMSVDSISLVDHHEVRFLDSDMIDLPFYEEVYRDKIRLDEVDTETSFEIVIPFSIGDNGLNIPYYRAGDPVRPELLDGAILTMSSSGNENSPPMDIPFSIAYSGESNVDTLTDSNSGNDIGWCVELSSLITTSGMSLPLIICTLEDAVTISPISGASDVYVETAGIYLVDWSAIGQGNTYLDIPSESNIQLVPSKYLAMQIPITLFIENNSMNLEFLSKSITLPPGTFDRARQYIAQGGRVEVLVSIVASGVGQIASMVCPMLGTTNDTLSYSQEYYSAVNSGYVAPRRENYDALYGQCEIDYDFVSVRSSGDYLAPTTLHWDCYIWRGNPPDDEDNTGDGCSLEFVPAKTCLTVDFTLGDSLGDSEEIDGTTVADLKTMYGVDDIYPITDYNDNAIDWTYVYSTMQMGAVGCQVRYNVWTTIGNNTFLMCTTTTAASSSPYWIVSSRIGTCSAIELCNFNGTCYLIQYDLN